MSHAQEQKKCFVLNKQAKQIGGKVTANHESFAA